ncbi:MAG: hypothetical protein IID18_07790 [Nitrospinae bacterium]|nr:hypothetical protein [Nitrospinota bacterium]
MASSFPSSLSKIPEDNNRIFTRKEFELFNRLWDQRIMFPRFPKYGDYGIQHSAFNGKDFRCVKTHRVNLRYLDGKFYIVIMRKDKNKFHYSQFNDACRELRIMKDFKMDNECLGDRYINECAENLRNPGDPTFWRQIGFSRHFWITCQQMASMGKMVVRDSQSRQGVQDVFQKLT